MIEVSNAVKQASLNNVTATELIISFPRNENLDPITLDNVVSESMNIHDALSDGSSFKFGGCIAAKFSIDLIDTPDRSFTSDELVGQWISIRLIQNFTKYTELYPANTVYPSNNLYPGYMEDDEDTSHTWYIFCGKIYAAPTDKNDPHRRTITAYDFLALLLSRNITNSLCSRWRTVLAHSSGASAEAKIQFLIQEIFSNNLMMAFPYDLVNNKYLKEKLLVENENDKVWDLRVLNRDWLKTNEEISYGELARDICELIGLFGRVRPDADIGTFVFIALGEGTELYTSNYGLSFDEKKQTGFTQVEIGVEIGVDLGSITVTNEKTQRLNIGKYYQDDNPENIPEQVYNLSDNILAWKPQGLAYTWFNSLYMSDTDHYSGSSANDRFYGVNYTPLSVKVDGRLWVEVGDKIQLRYMKTDCEGNPLDANGDIAQSPEDFVYLTVESYVLERTLSGILALTDNIEAKGENSSVI